MKSTTWLDRKLYKQKCEEAPTGLLTTEIMDDGLDLKGLLQNTITASMKSRDRLIIISHSLDVANGRADSA